MTWGDRITECDCCGARVSRERIGRVTAYGIETFACDVCRGEAPPERDESDRLVHLSSNPVGEILYRQFREDADRAKPMKMPRVWRVTQK